MEFNCEIENFLYGYVFRAVTLLSVEYEVPQKFNAFDSYQQIHSFTYNEWINLKRNRGENTK